MFEKKELLIPSIRTWSALFAVLLAPSVLEILQIPFSNDANIAVSAFTRALIVLIVISIYGSARPKLKIAHIKKDTLIHGLVLLAVYFSYASAPYTNWVGFTNISLFYIWFHIIAHIFDAAIPEKTGGRDLMIFLLTVLLSLTLLALGYSTFNLNNESII